MSEKQWDDSDSEDDNVVVEENPTIRPRKRQTSVAHTLEKDKTLNSSVAGSVKDSDESDSDDSDSIGTSAASDHMLDNEGEVTLDFDTTTCMKKMIAMYHCSYRDIINEFADVELFFISVDSLIVECLAHSYHDWTLVGQSMVLTKQKEPFLRI
ncbi:hypothetical protein WR25_07856 [Diploscapter pachys]|uniref:Uncharacterized protein n=1 Tax=Diploscapter pachys TaxID=2018661 RepID=A0A2A2KVU8_9BILA|nr:hypothetical protein WR25_07856 [Diploscapter pachys]